jgi:hypothetical protein
LPGLLYSAARNGDTLGSCGQASVHWVPMLDRSIPYSTGAGVVANAAFADQKTTKAIAKAGGELRHDSQGFDFDNRRTLAPPSRISASPFIQTSLYNTRVLG